VPDAAGLGADPGVTAAFEQAAAHAVRASATLVPVDLAPFLAAGELLYGSPWVAERLADLGPFLEAHPDAVLPVTSAAIQRARGFSAADAFRRSQGWSAPPGPPEPST
jgi:allophanate hydrolase